MPGVAGAWLALDLGLADGFMPDRGPKPPPARRPVLARDRVRSEGEAVAAVPAETDYQAAHAAAAVRVEAAPAAEEPPPPVGRAHAVRIAPPGLPRPAVAAARPEGP